VLVLSGGVQARELTVDVQTPKLTRQTLQKAIDAAKPGGELVLGAGTYELDAPLRVNGAITLRASKDAEVILSGGRRLTLQWSPQQHGIMQARLPDNLDLDVVAFDQLYLNGQRLHIARYPDYSPGQRYFGGTAADALSPERIQNWENPSGGFIHSLHRSEWGGNHWRFFG